MSAADSFKITNLSDADLSLHHHVKEEWNVLLPVITLFPGTFVGLRF